VSVRLPNQLTVTISTEIAIVCEHRQPQRRIDSCGVITMPLERCAVIQILKVKIGKLIQTN